MYKFNRPCGPCDFDDLNKGHADECGPCNYGPENHCEPNHCECVPPPIPPIKFVPGLNTQEQMCHVIDRTNQCIAQWNAIQKDCCEALNKMVGAAVSNNVYYSRHDVRLFTGFSPEDKCDYSYIKIRSCDSCGEPIRIHLVPAYGNQGNSGAKQKIEDASFITASNAMITAVSPAVNGWYGPAMICGNPVPYNQPETEDEMFWVGGFNRHGALLVFDKDVTPELLRQSRMVDCIGPVYPLVLSGKNATDVLEGIADVNTPFSIQAVGWSSVTNEKIFISCGMEENPGMTLSNMANVLVQMGMSTAFATCFMNKATTVTYAVEPASTGTGGMTYIGRQGNVPLNYITPANTAFWSVSRKPGPRWSNEFTAEIADLCQLYGSNFNALTNLNGEVKNIGDSASRIDGIDDRLTVAEETIKTLGEQVDTLETNVNALTTRLTEEVDRLDAQDETLDEKITAETNTRAEADTALQNSINNLNEAITKETTDREAADTTLQNQITAEVANREAADAKETADRIAADNALQTAIQQEAQTRNEADQNLINGQNNEQIARATKDAELDAKIDAAKAEASKATADLKETVDGILDGTAELPKATSEQFGIVKLGTGLEVGENGEINVIDGGNTVVAGEHIIIADEASGAKKISVKGSDFFSANDGASLQGSVNMLDTLTTAMQGDIDQNRTNIAKNATEINDLKTKEALDVADMSNRIDVMQGDVSANTADITDIKNGTTEIPLPVASAEKLGGIKVGANLSIDENGVLSATGGGQSGETVAAGTGITVEHAENVATVSVDTDIIATAESVRAAEKAASDALDAAKEAQAMKDSAQDTAIAGANTAISEEVQNRTAADTALQGKIDANTAEINTVKTEQATADARIEAVEDSVANIENGMTTLPYVKKSGDSMSGILSVNFTAETEESMENQRIIKAGFNSQSCANFAVIGETSYGSGANNKPHIKTSFDHITLSGKGNNNHVVLTGLNDGIENNDAVNVSQLNNVQSLARTAQDTADTASTTANHASSNADQALSDIAAIKAGTEELPYVKKSGDTMSGDLTVDNAAGESVLSVKATAENKTTVTGIVSNPDQSIIRTSNEIIKLDGAEGNPVQLKNVKAGTDDTDAANVAQLTARIEALEALLQPQIDAAKTAADEASAAVAGGPFLPLSGGNMTGSIYFPSGDIGHDGQSIYMYNNEKIPTIGPHAWAFNSPQDIAGNRIQGVIDPIYNHDAANKAYVDAKSANAVNMKSALLIGTQQRQFAIGTKASYLVILSNFQFGGGSYEGTVIIPVTNGATGTNTINVPGIVNNTIQKVVMNISISVSGGNVFVQQLGASASDTIYCTIIA